MKLVVFNHFNTSMVTNENIVGSCEDLEDDEALKPLKNLQQFYDYIHTERNICSSNLVKWDL